MRQLYTGAVTLWDNEKTADWWTSIYAAHFLIEANKAGFDVDKGLWKLYWVILIRRLKERGPINYYYNRDQVKRIVRKK